MTCGQGPPRCVAGKGVIPVLFFGQIQNSAEADLPVHCVGEP
jgi:hypothetical protein